MIVLCSFLDNVIECNHIDKVLLNMVASFSFFDAVRECKVLREYGCIIKVYCIIKVWVYGFIHLDICDDDIVIVMKKELRKLKRQWFKDKLKHWKYTTGKSYCGYKSRADALKINSRSDKLDLA